MADEDSETAAAKALRRLGTDEEERSRAAATLANRKHQLTTPRARRRACAQAAKSMWDRISPEQRVIEMRRRRKLGIIRKKRAALGQAEDK